MSDALTEEMLFLFLAILLGAVLFVLVINWAKIYPMLSQFLFSGPPTAEQEQYSKNSVVALACGINSVASGEVWDIENCPYIGSPSGGGQGGGTTTKNAATAMVTGMATDGGAIETNPFDDTTQTKADENYWETDKTTAPDLSIDCKKTKGVACMCTYTDAGVQKQMAAKIKAVSERAAEGLCTLKAYSLTKQRGRTSVSCEAAEIVTECTVKNFELPQDVSAAEKWIFTWGDPKFLVYFEQFPEGEDAAWNSMVTAKDLLLIGVFNLALPGAFDKAGPIIKKIGGTKLGQAASKIWETGKSWLSIGGKDATMEVTEETGKKIVQSATPKSVIGYLFYIPKQAFKAAKVGGEFVGARTAGAFASAATKLHDWLVGIMRKYTGRIYAEGIHEGVEAALAPTASGVRLGTFLKVVKELPEDQLEKYYDNIAELAIEGVEPANDWSIKAMTYVHKNAFGEMAEYKALTETEKVLFAEVSSNVMSKQSPTTLVKMTTAIAGMPLGREVSYDMAIEAAEATGKRVGGRTTEAGVILWLASLYDSKNEKFLPWGGTLVLAKPMQAVAPLPLKDGEFLDDTTIVVLKRGNPIKKFYMASPCKADVHLRKDVCQVKDWSYDKETNTRSFKTFSGAGVVWEHFDFWDPEYACPMNGEFASDCKVPCVVVDSIQRDSATSPNYCTASTNGLSLGVFIASQVAEWGAQIALTVFSAGTSLPLQAAVWTARVATTASVVGMEYSRKWP